MGSHGGSRAGGSGGGGRYSSADKSRQAATGGVVLKDELTEIEVDAHKRNSKSAYTYSKEVLKADVDEFGNVEFSYPKGNYSGDYGDRDQKVTYNIRAGLVDGNPINLDLSKAQAIEGKTYPARDAAKAAGMTYSNKYDAWLAKDHPLTRKTNYTDSELSSMSTSELRKVYDGSYAQYSKFRGKSIKQISSDLSNNKSKTFAKDQMIQTIKQANDYIKKNSR